MNTIQEALRALNISEATAVATKKRRRVRAFTDLWDQVYCSLTDGGADSAYSALGVLNGANKYEVDEVGTSDIRPGYNTIVISNPDNAWALHIADVYGLETKVSKYGTYIYVPENAPVNTEVIDKYRSGADAAEDDMAEDLEVELTEDVASSMPVSVLSHDEVYRYIENIPEATPERPPVFFQVGYIKELGSEILAKFRGGRGSEDNPTVRIFKCSEMTVYTGADYESLKATKAFRKETGKERSGEKTGFSFSGDTAIVDKIGISAKGEEQLQCYVRKGTKSKSKYFISLNDEDLREASRQEVAEYLTPAQAHRLLDGADVAAGPEGAKVVRLKLSGIYKIGNLGQSVM